MTQSTAVKRGEHGFAAGARYNTIQYQYKTMGAYQALSDTTLPGTTRHVGTLRGKPVQVPVHGCHGHGDGEGLMLASGHTYYIVPKQAGGARRGAHHAAWRVESGETHPLL
jgi:hypothetical protein